MHLLWSSDSHEAAGMVEAALIMRFLERPGRRNVALGGEGPEGPAPYFTYVVHAPCGDGVLLAPRPCKRKWKGNT